MSSFSNSRRHDQPVQIHVHPTMNVNPNINVSQSNSSTSGGVAKAVGTVVIGVCLAAFVVLAAAVVIPAALLAGAIYLAVGASSGSKRSDSIEARSYREVEQ